MYVLMDLIGDILPLLILIGIPVLRGLNSSSKRKKEYEEKRRRANYNPSTKEEPNVGSWRSIISEIEKELNKSKDKKKDKEKKVPSNNMETNKPQANLSQYQEEKLQHGVQDEQMGGKNINNAVEEKPFKSPIEQGEIEDVQDDLIFSSDPIVQGMIFSEIVGLPKSRRR